MKPPPVGKYQNCNITTVRISEGQVRDKLIEDLSVRSDLIQVKRERDRNTLSSSAVHLASAEASWTNPFVLELLLNSDALQSQ